MRNLLRKLPPMSTLRPFDAAARHQNFTSAANELFVTQAAVSKQVRLLEEHLGVALFARNGRNLELTAAGRDLHHVTAQALRRISRSAFHLQENGRKNRITIAMRVSFSNQFMAPRLGRLLQAFPDLDFHFLSTDRDPVALMEVVDLAVVLGHEPQPLIAADHLLTEEIAPVCSPGYLAANPDLKMAADIPRQKLLHLDEEHWQDLTWLPADWPVVLDKFGVQIEQDLAGPSFSSFDMLINAAIADHGVAIGWHHKVAHLVEDGKLVYPIEDKYRIDRRHYLLSRVAQSESSTIASLRDWFLEETSDFR